MLSARRLRLLELLLTLLERLPRGLSHRLGEDGLVQQQFLLEVRDLGHVRERARGRRVTQPHRLPVGPLRVGLELLQLVDRPRHRVGDVLVEGLSRLLSRLQLLVVSLVIASGSHTSHCTLVGRSIRPSERVYTPLTVHSVRLLSLRRNEQLPLEWRSVGIRRPRAADRVRDRFRDRFEDRSDARSETSSETGSETGSERRLGEKG